MRYWALFLIHMALGVALGLLVGLLAESWGAPQGWGLVGACVGGSAGLLAFLYRT